VLHRLILMAMLLACAPQAAHGQVVIGGGAGPGGRDSAPRQMMTMSSEPTQFEEFSKKLKLDDRTQLPDVRAIFMSASADASPIEREMMRLRLKMLEVASKPDELKPLIEAYAAAASKMAAIEVKALEQVRTLLKPNQLSKSAEAFVIMAGVFHPPTPRGGGPGGRRGGGALLAEGTVVSPVPQRGGGAGTGGGMRMGGRGFVPLTRLTALVGVLGMSEAQKKRTKEILDAEYRAAAPLREQLLKTRTAIGEAIQGELESSFITQLVADYSAPVAEMAAAEVKALVKLLALEPDQQTNSRAVEISASLMRGAFIGKKWDTTPDIRFY
jgi:hypothetical protein